MGGAVEKPIYTESAWAEISTLSAQFKRTPLLTAAGTVQASGSPQNCAEPILNGGTYGGRFEPSPEQVSVLLEAHMPWPGAPEFEAQAALGLDAGELYDGAVGAQVGLVYRPRMR